MHAGWLKRWRSVLPKALGRRGGQAPSAVEALPSPAAPGPPSVEGSQRGWLRVLPAQDLLASLRADQALEALWRQSRLAEPVWARDLLPAIHRHAEFVQLMPASESHHHAHVGGLLAHTLEMALAAVTWRNGHLLPTGAGIEQIDEERDVWTYVVFFAALLHDIAKPLTDLRIQWRAAQMPEPLRWTPVAGSLVQLAHGRRDAEYLVEFTPKSMRDYGAHSRLAVTLLGQIAPPTALSFMARTPQAMEVLVQYLSGLDKTSLVARIVSRADQASTQKALLSGNRARFDTATSVPLIELLMNALKSMLRSGTALPLNRSGAAGWVHDGSVWLVAKRVADGVRAWIRQHAPHESIPGDNKNDRLFDTWQEYGCIQPNPYTGQAVWYVVVHGHGVPAAAASGQTEEGAAEEGAAYSHSLTVLRFPLARLYDDPAQYPPEMGGRIEVRDKRPSKDAQDEAVPTADAPVAKAQGPEAVQSSAQEIDAGRVSAKDSTDADASSKATAAGSPGAPAKPKGHGPKPIRAPGFNKPQAAAVAPSAAKSKESAAKRQPPQAASGPMTGEITIGGGIDGFDVDDGLLDDDDDVRVAVQATGPQFVTGQAARFHQQAASTTVPKLPANRPKPAAVARNKPQAAAMPAARPAVRPAVAKLPRPEPVAARTVPDAALPAPPGRLIEPAAPRALIPGPSAAAGSTPDPVVLMPRLPELPQQAASRQAEPSATALAFIQWLQQGLASRELKYNESGAPVHFTAEGMALVSPLIFKLYARETGPEAQADIMGLQVQREVLKAGWHLMVAAKGAGKVNIVRYEVLGRGGVAVSKLSAVVLTAPDRFVLPVPPVNPVLKLV